MYELRDKFEWIRKNLELYNAGKQVPQFYFANHYYFVQIQHV